MKVHVLTAEGLAANLFGNVHSTGIFATEEEAAEISRVVDLARSTPVIFAGGPVDAATHSWETVHRTIYRYALGHGLPEIDGYYGIDLRTREFVSPVPLALEGGNER